MVVELNLGFSLFLPSPEIQWVIAPQVFEAASADSTALGLGDISLPAPVPPPGPVLQSGETFSVVKEAELGNFQRQTEEVGYPAVPTGFGQQAAILFMPHFGAGGSRGFRLKVPGAKGRRFGKKRFFPHARKS